MTKFKIYKVKSSLTVKVFCECVYISHRNQLATNSKSEIYCAVSSSWNSKNLVSDWVAFDFALDHLLKLTDNYQILSISRSCVFFVGEIKRDKIN